MYKNILKKPLYFFKKSKKDIKICLVSGFTIIELVVVFAISAVIFAIVVSGYPSFLKKSELENTTLEVALTIREAQVYGMGIREASGGFDSAYGAWFDLDASHKRFTIFTDSNNNQIYDIGEEVSVFRIETNFEISNLCVTAGALTDCNIRILSLLFKRPNPDAIIYSPVISPGTSATIEIKSIRTGDIKVVKITNTGQISVQ